MTKHLKPYWQNHNLGWQINGAMALLVVIGFVLAFFCSGVLQDIGLNLAFMALGVILTVYFVDTAIKRREERRWSSVDNVAQRFLRRAATEYLYSITRAFDSDGEEPYMITGFERRAALEQSHLKLARDPAWHAYLRDTIFPRAQFIGFDTFKGANDPLAQSLAAYHSRLTQLWPLMSSRWTPAQIAEVLELIFEIPREIGLLEVNTQPGVNTGPAVLNSINERSLRLIQQCNAEDDPGRYILPNDPEFDDQPDPESRSSSN